MKIDLKINQFYFMPVIVSHVTHQESLLKPENNNPANTIFLYYGIIL